MSIPRLPEGYSLVNGSIRIESSDGKIGGIDIHTNNHDFAFYDRQFYKILSKYLQDHDDIALLDIGGGRLSIAVQQIMEHFPNVGAKNTDLLAENGPFAVNGNASQLFIKDQSIDAIVSVNSVAYLLALQFPEAQKIMGEMVRVLKPGGHVFISPGVDLTIWSSQLEAVIGMYGKNTFGQVYINRNQI